MVLYSIKSGVPKLWEVTTEHGWVAEWSKALVLGTSLFGGVGSNPTPVTIFCESP